MWSQRHPERAEAILAPDIVEHVWNAEGPNALQAICMNTHSLFEDFHIVIEEIISEGSLADEAKITCRFKAMGRWTQDYDELKATGEELEFPGLFLWRIKRRLIKESWIYQSFSSAPQLGLMLQGRPSTS